MGIGIARISQIPQDSCRFRGIPVGWRGINITEALREILAGFPQV